MIGDFHFLRPEWLLGLLAAAGLLWAVSRREDARARWKNTIAAHLLDHLVVDRRGLARWRPVHLTALWIALGSLAAAGPTWQREQSPFVEDTAPLAIAIDLSATMDAIDVSPSRLERAKLKVRDLLVLRKGARTSLVAYAGSAHLVLPLTGDDALLRTYVDSLATSIMPVPGKDTAQALRVAAASLAPDSTPGTIVFMTDGVEAAAFDALAQYRGNSDVIVLGIGTAAGGPVKTGPGAYLEDAGGRRVFARLDVDALRRLQAAGVQVATVTLDDADVEWIARHAQSHLEQQTAEANARWRDVGWYLTAPIALLCALWFRRGWTIRWAGVWLLAAALAAPDRARADALDAWLTPDQQGRLAFERGDYATAAERFTDPMWRGAAAYRAGRYEAAIDAFARVNSPESDFDQGNALAHTGRLEAAAASYRRALARRPDWAAAKANLALIEGLLKQRDEDEQEEAPALDADQVQFDERGKKGKRGNVQAGRDSAEMWMRNIQVTPAQLLERRFAIEAERSKP